MALSGELRPHLTPVLTLKVLLYFLLLCGFIYQIGLNSGNATKPCPAMSSSTS